MIREVEESRVNDETIRLSANTCPRKRQERKNRIPSLIQSSASKWRSGLASMISKETMKARVNGTHRETMPPTSLAKTM